MKPTAEQIRKAREQAELEAFKRLALKLQIKNMPKWADIRGRCER